MPSVTFADDAQVAPTDAATVQPGKDEWRVLLERQGVATPRNLSLEEAAKSLTRLKVQLSRPNQVVTEILDPHNIEAVLVGNSVAQEVVTASCHLMGTSASNVTFGVYLIDPGVSSVLVDSTKTITAGNGTVDMSSLVGTAIPANSIVALRVTSGALDARGLFVTLEVN